MIPLASVPAPVSSTDGFGFLAVLLGGGILLYLGLIALGVWAAYWFIRLAVRHAGMDVARWQRAGMPDRMPKKYRAREPRPWNH